MQKYLAEVEELLDRLYIAAEGAGLRQEDRRKACEVAAMLEEIELAASRFARRSTLLLVDAAAGKSYVGLLAAKIIFDASGRNASVITIERDPQRVEASSRAADRLGSTVRVECREASVEAETAWPPQPSIITALHSCGDAADAIIDRAIACRARMLLLVPCCTSEAVAASSQACAHADALGVPRHAPVRRRFIQSVIDAERTWRLEAAGYETEVVEFVAPTVTPHNLLWRARLVGEPRRMAAAKNAWAHLMAVRPNPS
jgi:precorrin-6B methylase 2